MKTSSKLVVAVFGFLMLADDQLTKTMVSSYVNTGETIPIIPGCLNLTLTYNRGVAFGLLADAPEGSRQLLIAGLTVLALGVVVWLLVKDYREHLGAQFALALIIGGAIGNVIDRIRFGHVIDFIDAYYGYRHWPAFNLADSAICVGVVLLFLISFFSRPAPLPRPPTAKEKVAARPR